MNALQRPLTYDDLLEMPDDGLRRELLGGELIVTPAPSPGHQRILRSLFLAVNQHVVGHGLGEVFFAPVDVRLGRFNIVQPDMIFLASARPRVPDAQQAIDGAPDLVVEVISPSSAGIDRVRKMALYADSGIAEYWIADPAARSIVCYSLVDGEYREIVPDATGAIASRVLPGLLMNPGDILVELD